MKIRFQSMAVPCDFTPQQIAIVNYAINKYGDGSHPMCTAETLPDFDFRYVIRCLTKLAVADVMCNTNSNVSGCLDVVRNAVNHNRAVTKFTNEAHREMMEKENRR